MPVLGFGSCHRFHLTLLRQTEEISKESDRATTQKPQRIHPIVFAYLQQYLHFYVNSFRN